MVRPVAPLAVYPTFYWYYSLPFFTFRRKIKSCQPHHPRCQQHQGDTNEQHFFKLLYISKSTNDFNLLHHCFNHTFNFKSQKRKKTVPPIQIGNKMVDDPALHLFHPDHHSRNHGIQLVQERCESDA